MQEQDYQRNVRYRDKSKINKPRQCNVALRDCLSGEIITVYLPVTISSAAIVGLRVVIYNATIHLAESLRNIYLKYSIEHNTQIGEIM